MLLGVEKMIRYESEKIDKVLLDNELVVFHKIDNVHYMDKPHFHNGYEVHFTLTNATSYQVDGRTYVADAGSVALFSSEEIHRVSIDRNKLYERYCILFKPSFVEEFTSHHPTLLEIYNRGDCIPLNEGDKKKMIRLFEELIAADKREESIYRLLAKIKLIEILVFITERMEKDEDSLVVTQHTNQVVLSKIIAYIKNQYMEEITLDLLSDIFFLSKSTIIRMFKTSIGMTPNQYLIYTRIMRSRDLLQEGYTVKEVAIRIGYKDESSFIKKFKELQGESPKQYALKMLRS